MVLLLEAVVAARRIALPVVAAVVVIHVVLVSDRPDTHTAP